MRLKRIIDEDFVNYKKISMFIASNECDWKCCREQGLDKSICQNSELAESKTIDMSADAIFRRYINNPISKCIVIGGLEPMMQLSEVLELIDTFRQNGCSDEFIIYTGYDYTELEPEIEKLKKYKNIIMKFGRYRTGNQKHYDDILGIYLASDEQYALKIS